VASFFFTFLKKFLNGPGGPFVYAWFVLGGFVAGFVLDYAFSFVRKCVSVRSFACARMTKEPATGRYPSCEVWSYILYKYTPSSLRLETGGIFFPWLIICAPGCVAGL
jgi:hypothetical protein